MEDHTPRSDPMGLARLLEALTCSSMKFSRPDSSPNFDQVHGFEGA